MSHAWFCSGVCDVVPHQSFQCKPCGPPGCQAQGCWLPAPLLAIGEGCRRRRCGCCCRCFSPRRRQMWATARLPRCRWHGCCRRHTLSCCQSYPMPGVKLRQAAVAARLNLCVLAGKEGRCGVMFSVCVCKGRAIALGNVSI